VSRLRWKIKWKLQGPLCRLGWHGSYPADVANDDGSITEAFCMRCFATLPPIRPRDPNPEFAAWYAQIRGELDDYLAEEEDDEDRYATDDEFAEAYQASKSRWRELIERLKR
jgi:hypothetical protein